MDLNLNLIQEQKLVMTQEMRLSLKVLQMSSLELREYVDKEYQENPILEIESASVEPKEEMDYKSLMKYLDSNGTDSSEPRDFDQEKTSPLDYVSVDETLSDYLQSQLCAFDLDDYEETLCMFIIDSLNSWGYFTDDLPEVAELIGASLEDMEKALLLVQSLEPMGIGARNLKDCLIIQLISKGIFMDAHEIIIDEHLGDIAEGRISTIAKSLKMEISEVQNLVDEIRELEPKPSRGFFDGRKPSYIHPDGTITVENGEISLTMNNEFIPRLMISKVYKDFKFTAEQKETKEYLNEMMNKAIFLLKSIDKRKDTLKLVLEEIVKRQKTYFLCGGGFLKPLTMKDIAEELGIHESTISRAIREKYVLTPKGIIRIKDLFKTAAKGAGEEVSTDYVIDHIKSLIQGEDRKNPLSDQAITDILNGKGIDIKRRTVAKYRDELGINSSSKRKRG